MIDVNELRSVYKDLIRCNYCGCKDTWKLRSFGTTISNNGVMIVGEAPGMSFKNKIKKSKIKSDTKTYTKIMTGSSVEEYMNGFGLTLDKYFFTNLVKCPHDKTPIPATIERCGKYLDRQIKAYSPKLIITLGKKAAEYILKKDDYLMRLNHGCTYFSDGIPVLTLLHPSYFRREGIKISENQRMGIKGTIEGILGYSNFQIIIA